MDKVARRFPFHNCAFIIYNGIQYILNAIPSRGFLFLFLIMSMEMRRAGLYMYLYVYMSIIVQELRESRGGRPGLSVLTSLLVSVDVKNY